jgi:hypothetical protein
MDLEVSVARRGGLGPQDIISTLSLKDLLAVMRGGIAEL